MIKTEHGVVVFLLANAFAVAVGFVLHSPVAPTIAVTVDVILVCLEARER